MYHESWGYTMQPTNILSWSVIYADLAIIARGSSVKPLGVYSKSDDWWEKYYDRKT